MTKWRKSRGIFCVMPSVCTLRTFCIARRLTALHLAVSWKRKEEEKGKGLGQRDAHKFLRIACGPIGAKTQLQQKAGHRDIFMMANKEAIHHRNGDPPKLDKPFPVDGSFVAQTHDLVHATCELETHGLGDPIVWP